MEFLETSVFTKQITDILPDYEYADLQVHLTKQPEAGALIPGGGGLRKVRWKARGKGREFELFIISTFLNHKYLCCWLIRKVNLLTFQKGNSKS